MQAVGDGDLGAREAAELAKLVADFSQTLTSAHLEQRVEEIERTVRVLKSK